VVIPSESVTIPPGQQARFAVRFNDQVATEMGSIVHVETSDDSDGKIDLPIALGKRVSDFTPLAYAYLPGSVDFGPIIAGASAKFELPVQNLGEAVLNIRDVTLRSQVAGVAADFNPLASVPLKSGEKGAITFELAAAVPGTIAGQIEVVSDARNGVVLVDFVANVLPKPDVVVIDTIPRGATVQVNGVGTPTPAAFTIVDTTPIAGQFQRGQTVSVLASPVHTADGLPYEFQRWEPGTRTNLSFVAGNSAYHFTARYAQSLIVGPTVAEPPLVQAGPCTFNPPTDVAFGPWVKISQARLTLPWLGDSTAGSHFGVNGSLFLSLNRAFGSLSSSRIRVAVPSSAPAFRGVEVMEITPASWAFDLQSGLFQLKALSPGLQVLNASTLPPASLRIEGTCAPTLLAGAPLCALPPSTICRSSPVSWPWALAAPN
jgi:hypothetical protein